MTSVRDTKVNDHQPTLHRAQQRLDKLLDRLAIDLSKSKDPEKTLRTGVQNIRDLLDRMAPGVEPPIMDVLEANLEHYDAASPALIEIVGTLVGLDARLTASEVSALERTVRKYVSSSGDPSAARQVALETLEEVAATVQFIAGNIYPDIHSRTVDVQPSAWGELPYSDTREYPIIAIKGEPNDDWVDKLWNGDIPDKIRNWSVDNLDKVSTAAADNRMSKILKFLGR